jgi:hypothetical protein
MAGRKRTVADTAVQPIGAEVITSNDVTSPAPAAPTPSPVLTTNDIQSSLFMGSATEQHAHAKDKNAMITTNNIGYHQAKRAQEIEAENDKKE